MNKKVNTKKAYLKRNYYKNCYGEFAKPIVQTFEEFSLEDCVKYLIVNNVKYHEYSTWNNTPKRIEEMKKDDELKTLANLYGIDNINRKIIDGSEDVAEDLDDLLNKALAFKFRYGISGVWKSFTDKVYKQRKEYFATPQLKRLEQAIYSVASAMNERFVEKYDQFEMSDDFIDYVSDLDRNYDEVNRAYSIMYGIQKPEDNKQYERSFAKWIDLLQSHQGNYLDYKKAVALEKIKDISPIPDALAYLRSKTRDTMNNMLLEEEKTEDADRLAQIINYVNSSKQEEFDRIALNYVRECIDNGTARELPRGILSREFIKAHRRELMKMIVESGYSDEDALAMMNDLMNQQQFDEVQM